jgi:hypothetical protein
MDGFTNFFIDDCGLIEGGPWPWNAAWQNSAQPTVIRTAEVIASADKVEPVPESADESTTVTRVN